MFRSKDFILMDVVDIKGKKIGFIKDILVNFHSGEVIGFEASCYNLFQKSISILKENIISYNKAMVIKGSSKKKFFKFSDFKEMEIINSNGEIIGMVEDIVFHEFTFKLQAIISSSGFIKNLISGKEILLINSLILGERSVFYFNSKENINFLSIPHKLFSEVGAYEKKD